MNITDFIKKELIVNNKLLKNITRFRLLWGNHNSSRINWLSGPHIGIEPVRFLTKEEDDFFDLVVKIDKGYLDKYIKDSKNIDETWKVGGNTFNLLIVSLMVIIHDDKSIHSKAKEQAYLDLFSILAYRLLTSMIANSFHFNLDKDLAETVYESMSRRFLIKRLGSWNALITYRAKDFQAKGIYNKRLSKAKDVDIVKLVAAISTRLKDHFKEQYSLIETVKENKEKRLSTNVTKNGEDGEYILDTQNINKEYFNYALAMVPIKSEFIDKDIFDIVTSIYTRAKKKEVLSVLTYMSDHYLEIKNIEKIIEAILKANIEYIYGGKLYPPYHNRILQVMTYNKGLWTSSRVKDKNVIYTKKELSKLITKVTGKTVEWTITPAISVIVMYIFVSVVIGYNKK